MSGLPGNHPRPSDPMRAVGSDNRKRRDLNRANDLRSRHKQQGVIMPDNRRRILCGKPEPEPTEATS